MCVPDVIGALAVWWQTTQKKELSKVHCGSAFGLGACRLPYYCTIPVTVAVVMGARTLFQQDTKKKSRPGFEWVTRTKLSDVTCKTSHSRFEVTQAGFGKKNCSSKNVTFFLELVQMWRFRHIVTSFSWVQLGTNLGLKIWPGSGFQVLGSSFGLGATLTVCWWVTWKKSNPVVRGGSPPPVHGGADFEIVRFPQRARCCFRGRHARPWKSEMKRKSF